MAEPIEKLFESTPAPDTMVLLGKGPSLDNYRREYAQYPHMALNEAIEGLPGEYGLYCDTACRVLYIPSTTTLIRPDTVADLHKGQGYITSRDWIQSNGHKPRGSPGLALYVCGAWGVKRIIFVGFDAYDHLGEQRFARCLPRIVRLPTNPTYNSINEGIRNALEWSGMEAVWFHRNVQQEHRACQP